MSVYVGIGVHHNRSQVAVIDEGGKVLVNRNVTNGVKPLLPVIGGLPAGTAAAYEAAFGWGWLPGLLEDYGFEPHMVHPLQCKAIASARLKNDKADAATLAQLLRADLLPEARIAPPAVRQLRALLRHRAQLVRLRTLLRNRIHAVLAGHGHGRPAGCRAALAGRGSPRQVFEHVRALGLTRPGQPAAGMSDDFALLAGDVPHPPQPGEPSRDLPAEIIAQLCGHLDELEAISSRRMRVAVELLIDTGRRPGEICTLGFGCLDRDSDEAPVLVYDNHKAARLGRRLPVSEATAELITAQQAWIRARFPHTPAAGLKLLPTVFANPEGRKGIRTESVSERHRTWVDALPPLLRADGSEYDKAKITLYAYRHAQRHADAGVPVDVLRELMDHRLLDATRQYYRVGEVRRRQAVDRVAAMQFDRNGNRTWQRARALLDSEHVRRAVGQVAVPFGVCTEPSNVKAGGQACPFRFRRAGCDHFRTDVSYLPDLQAYLDDLLRSRERLLAVTELDDWARADALPSEEEITRIRRLITRIKTGLGELTAAERDQIDQAIAVVRRHRAVMLGMPRIRQMLPAIRPGRTA